LKVWVGLACLRELAGASWSSKLVFSGLRTFVAGRPLEWLPIIHDVLQSESVLASGSSCESLDL